MPTDVAASPSGPIAVLGGTGMIGRHVIDALLAQGGSDIIATFHSRPAFGAPGITWRQADLLQPPGAAEALRGVRAAVLCAGRLSTAAELNRDPIGSVMDTLRIGQNAIEAAARSGIGQVILISSCTGYPDQADAKEEPAMFAGDPPPAWFGVGWAHRFLEKQLEWQCRHLGRIGSAVALRPTLVYGPHDDFSPESGHFVPSFIHRVIARERPIEVWGDGTQTRNLIHAADVATAVTAALASPQGYAAYNVAAPQSVSVNEVLATLIEVDGFADAEVVHRLDKGGGASAHHVSDAAFRKRFGWRPAVSLRDGLAGTVEWYRRTQASAR